MMIRVGYPFDSEPLRTSTDVEVAHHKGRSYRSRSASSMPNQHNLVVASTRNTLKPHRLGSTRVFPSKNSPSIRSKSSGVYLMYFPLLLSLSMIELQKEKNIAVRLDGKENNFFQGSMRDLKKIFYTLSITKQSCSAVNRYERITIISCNKSRSATSMLRRNMCLLEFRKTSTCSALWMTDKLVTAPQQLPAGRLPSIQCLV